MNIIIKALLERLVSVDMEYERERQMIFEEILKEEPDDKDMRNRERKLRR